MPMSDDELKRARELCEAATPGPWHASSHGTLKDGSPNPDWFASGHGGTITMCLTEPTAKFIAASRTLVEQLLDEVAQLKANQATAMDLEVKRVDLIQKQQVRITNLLASLAKSNANHEHFEREWYLRGDEIERLKAELDKARLIAEQRLETIEVGDRVKNQLEAELNNAECEVDDLHSQLADVEQRTAERIAVRLESDELYDELRESYPADYSAGIAAALIGAAKTIRSQVKP